MRGLFTQTLIAPEQAIDVNGHVNNLEYLRWMQEIATAHSAAQGWNLARYQQTRTSWVIRSHAIEYLRPAFAGETMLLGTWIAGFGEQMSPRKYLFLRADDRKILARAETLWVYVDATIGRPCLIPETFREAFTVIADEAEALQGMVRLAL
ncbi:MAG: acyl-CoA thioesterase [Chloroflexia bacterium]|nr:acyl-CoA thioesterase [Chloroflexia bacterium]